MWQCEWHEANLQARNAIPFRSYCMAPRQKSTRLSAIVDKGRRVFGNRSTDSTQSLPGDPFCTTNPLTPVPVTPPSTTSQKRFKKSNDARRDMSVLAMTYILQDNPTLRELICLIIGLNDHDDSGKVCITCNPWYSSEDDNLSSSKSSPFLSHSQSNLHLTLRKIRPKH